MATIEHWCENSVPNQVCSVTHRDHSTKGSPPCRRVTESKLALLTGYSK